MGAECGIAEDHAPKPITPPKSPGPRVNDAAPGLADARQAQCGELIDFKRDIVGEVVGVCGWRSSGDEEVTCNAIHDQRDADKLSEAQSLSHPDKEVGVRWLNRLEDDRCIETSDVLDARFFVTVGDLKEDPFKEFLCGAAVPGSRIEESVSADRIARAETLTDPCGGERKAGPTRTC
jgi:hypothetical protein